MKYGSNCVHFYHFDKKLVSVSLSVQKYPAVHLHISELNIYDYRYSFIAPVFKQKKITNFRNATML